MPNLEPNQSPGVSFLTYSDVCMYCPSHKYLILTTKVEYIKISFEIPECESIILHQRKLLLIPGFACHRKLFLIVRWLT